MFAAKKVLLTGATGFVGACLAHRLVSLGCDLHLTLREQSNLWRLQDLLKDAKRHIIDLNDNESTYQLIGSLKPEIIFHLATYGGFPFQKDLHQMVETNLRGTLNLLNACLKVGFEAFINTGSSSEYGPKKSAMKETDLLEPNTNYGITKSAATMYCQSIGRKDHTPVVTLRLFSPFGYFEEATRLIPTVITACLRGENPRLASGDAVRDFIFVEDVLDVYCKVVAKKIGAGEILNVGSGVQHSVADVVEKIIKITGAMVSPEWGSEPGRIFDTNQWVADISKIKRTLDWEPRYSLEDGLEKTIAWFQNNQHLYSVEKRS